MQQTDRKHSSLTLIAWLWNILKENRLQATLNTLIGCIAVALDFAFIATTKYTIDIATHTTNGSLTLAATILIGILLLQLSMSYASRWIKALLGVKAQNHMQRTWLHRLMNTGRAENGHERHSGDILNRLERDVRDVVGVVTDTLPASCSTLIRLLGAFLFLYAMDARLACLCIIIIPLFLGLSKIYMRRMRKLTREVRASDSHIQSIMQESVQHRTVIQTLGGDTVMEERLNAAHKLLYSQTKTRTTFSSTSAALMTAGFMTCYLTAFLWGANRLMEGTITYGMMIAFIQLVGQIQAPFRDMTRFIPIIVGAFTAAERLMELEETPLENRIEHTKDKKGIWGVKFTDVTCRYTPTTRAILQDFSADFPPGSHTAIVGETGVGKTTVIRLMLALLQPEKGRVDIYNRKGECEKIEAGTRCRFTYVPQGNTLLSGTIRENLTLGNANATPEEMEKALRDACADFVFTLPEGLETPCGEHGKHLSEGQAQRIAIARALLHPGGILLLDEATSALDSETEAKLWKNITKRWEGHTLICVTHRTAVITPETRVLRIP